MKYLFSFCLLVSVALGQGVVLPTQQALKVVNGVTSPVANATITVCAANASGIPCAPALVSAIFKDAALTQPLTNPFTSDANGNYVFAIAPGNYTVTVSAATFTGYSYQTTAPLSASAINTFTNTNTFTGATNLNGGGSLNGNFGGTNGFTGASTFAKFNSIIYVDGVTFTTVAAALAALPALGGTVVVPPHYRETFTSTIQVGSGRVGGSPVTNAVTLQVMGDVILTCNITNGTSCFKLGSGSGITGVSQSFGAPGNGAGQNAGSTIFVPSTASILHVIQPLFTDGTEQSFFVQGMIVTAATNATVAAGGAVVDVEGAADQTYIINNTFIQFPGILIRLRGNTGVSGPCCAIQITGNWLDAGGTSGGITNCQPVVIQQNSGAVEGITFNTNSITNSCATFPLISIDGQGGTQTRDIVFINTHLERDVANTANWIRIRDAQNIAFIGLETTDAGSGVSDLFNISQSAANLTQSVHIQDVQCIASITNCINDTIGSITFPLATYGQYYPDYKFLRSGAYAFTNAVSNAYTTLANADFQPGLRIGDTSAASTNSANFQLCDNNGPICWNVRKNGTPLAFIAPSGGTLSIPDNASSFNLTTTIASGTAAMTTAAIAAGACGTTVTVAAAGVATTDTITWAFNAAPGGQNAGLVAWPTSGNVNFAYCSNTAETPAAATINWRVIR